MKKVGFAPTNRSPRSCARATGGWRYALVAEYGENVRHSVKPENLYPYSVLGIRGCSSVLHAPCGLPTVSGKVWHSASLSQRSRCHNKRIRWPPPPPVIRNSVSSTSDRCRWRPRGIDRVGAFHHRLPFCCRRILRWSSQCGGMYRSSSQCHHLGISRFPSSRSRCRT